ncbi:hypothetical protein ACJMK2_031699 [Sinanodonta woodiana]|uniref:Uncharacterized protein n=1 Tax=Sinanodonta woodiana TaxID=1069815 RepID=A0ABD3X1B7_SINWO
MAVVTLAAAGYVIWIHQKRLSTLEAGRTHSHKAGDHDLYITPIGGDCPLPIPMMKDGNASNPITEQFDSSMLILHTNPNSCMDGYEMVDVSSIESGERVCNSDETVYEPTEIIDNPVDDRFGYLTVLGVLETSV